MGSIFSDDARYARWLQVELAATRAFESRGTVPAGTAAAIDASAKIDPDRIAAIEQITKHDVAAFVDSIAETSDEARNWLHFGLTSYDVVDTAQALALVDACDELGEGLRELLRALKSLTLDHANTACIARTHGIHAEPTVFGARIASHLFAFHRHLARLDAARGAIAVGKIAGPVGNYASVDPDVESTILEALGLVAEPAPTQIVSRDRHAQYLATLAGIGGSIEHLATEIRHLARTEVREAEEPFEKGSQKGSSSMPHKRNPWRCERLCGLARLLRGYALAGFESIATWHERDMSQSSVERVALVDASIVCDFAIHEMTEIISGLVVYPDRMKRNLESNLGLFASQHVLNELVKRGSSRDEAYRIVQKAAMTSYDEQRPFIETLKEDNLAAELDLDEIVSVERFTTSAKVIIDRVKKLEI